MEDGIYHGPVERVPVKNSTEIFVNGSLQYSDEFQLGSFVQVASICGIVLVTCGSLLNIAIFVTFLRRPKLIKSFTVHVMNNVVLEVICACSFSVLYFYRNFSRELFRSNGFCALLKYFNWTMPAMLVLQHGIISADRWLAIMAPVWYREKKTVKLGCFETVCAFLYVQGWYLPLFIADTLRIKPAGQYCDDTASWPRYQLVVRMCIAVIPVLVMDLSYPFLLYRVWHHGRTVKAHSHPHQTRSYASHSPVTTSRGHPDSAAHHHHAKSHRHMGLAMWLLVVQMILWTPSNVTNMMIGLRIGAKYLYDVHSFAIIISGTLLFVDPIVYLAFMKELRVEVTHGIRSCLTGKS